MAVGKNIRKKKGREKKHQKMCFKKEKNMEKQNMKNNKYQPNGIIVFVNPRSSYQKMVLYVSLLNTVHYKVWIKGKWSNTRKGVAPPTHTHTSE